jgi:hypothetical protein
MKSNEIRSHLELSITGYDTVVSILLYKHYCFTGFASRCPLATGQRTRAQVLRV